MSRHVKVLIIRNVFDIFLAKTSKNMQLKILIFVSFAFFVRIYPDML
jgi:hypothetical protein